jgi:hypothetical protein
MRARLARSRSKRTSWYNGALSLLYICETFPAPPSVPLLLPRGLAPCSSPAPFSLLLTSHQPVVGRSSNPSRTSGRAKGTCGDKDGGRVGGGGIRGVRTGEAVAGDSRTHARTHARAHARVRTRERRWQCLTACHGVSPCVRHCSTVSLCVRQCRDGTARQRERERERGSEREGVGWGGRTAQ